MVIFGECYPLKKNKFHSPLSFVKLLWIWGLKLHIAIEQLVFAFDGSNPLVLIKV